MSPDDFFVLPRWQEALRAAFLGGRPDSGHGDLVDFIGEVDWQCDASRVQIAVARKIDGNLLAITFHRRGSFEFGASCMSHSSMEELIEHLAFFLPVPADEIRRQFAAEIKS